jgi:hypothetical protein
MTDSKKSPTKLRKPLFWRRKEQPEPAKTVPEIEATQPRRPWYRPTLLKTALQKVQSLMSSYMAAPLKTINQSEQSISSYEQQVVYPLTAINQAKSSVTQFEGQFSSINNMFHVSVSSATLPQSQSLETTLLSRNASNVPTVTSQYQSVYGVVMAQNAASPQVRTMTDMTDAQAQDAMKRALQIDALAESELAEATQMGQQISQAAPGSAPILEAEADVWVVRANA